MFQNSKFIRSNSRFDKNGEKNRLSFLKQLKSGQINNQMKVLKLPYQGQRLAMYLILPNNDNTIDDIEANLEELYETDLILTPSLTEVHLPKFKIESEFQLKNALSNLGLNSVFNPFEADLTGTYRSYMIQIQPNKPVRGITYVYTERIFDSRMLIYNKIFLEKL